MTEMTEAELQDLRERWEAIRDAMDVAWDAVTEIMELVIEALEQIVLYFAEMVQRAFLCQLLPQWIPASIRSWLARHWPRALLPELGEAIEWMKTEAAQ